MYGKDNDGIGRPLKVDNTGMIRSDLGQAAIEGRLFHVNTATTVTTSTTLNTTWTGLGICNPSGSGKLIIVHEFGFGATRDLQGTGALQLGLTTSSGFSASLTVKPSLHGGSSGSVAQAMEGATVVAPVVCKTIGMYGDGESEPYLGLIRIVDLKGSIVIRPGYALLTNTTTAVSDLSFHFQWEEIDE